MTRRHFDNQPAIAARSARLHILVNAGKFSVKCFEVRCVFVAPIDPLLEVSQPNRSGLQQAIQFGAFVRRQRWQQCEIDARHQ
jgi:hypothetical protein